MLSFNEENRKLAGEKYNNSLCNQLFMLDELESLFENKLFLAESALAIEAHLWIQPTNEMTYKLKH